MSKTDTSLGPLVGILRFDAPSKSTRTLSATQAYDTSRSQIVLGNFTGKLTDKTATEKDGKHDPWQMVVLTTTTTDFGDWTDSVVGAKVDGDPVPAFRTVTLSALGPGGTTIQEKAACFGVDNGCPQGVTFSGAAGPKVTPAIASSSNSKAINANTTYYGAITVGLGEYKKWQGNYAVLKINTVTEKAVLRIYAN